MIDILMATYNGEAFVEEQVRSIINQSYPDWRLLVHDDGSNDGTWAILQQLSQEDSRIVLIEDHAHGLGVARHFIHLLQYTEAPYYMFCDQDDIWLPDKVEKMYHAICSLDPTCPQVVYSNAYLWDATQGIISAKNTLTYPTSLRQMLFLNTGIQGAASIFNHAMCTYLREPLDYYAMHDHILLLSGICFGQVTYLHESLMYYRQHDNNVTGHAPGSIRKKVMLMWHNRHIPLVSKLHYDGLEAFYRHWKKELKIGDKALIEAFLQMAQQTNIQRLANIIRHRFKLFDSTALLIVKFFIRHYL